MDVQAITAVGPVDGRYQNKTSELADYFSEFGLIKYRLQVEIEYFIALCEIPLPPLSAFPKQAFNQLRSIYKEFTPPQALEIKEIERTTNHDVKAVEYFIKNKFEALKLNEFKEFIHFGLTSQDINNTATPLSLKEGLEKVYVPVLEELISDLLKFQDEWKDVPMLARTHGQPASPTILGKEIRVFTERLSIQLHHLEDCYYPAKFGGATGNFNAHMITYPDINWVAFANELVDHRLGLHRSQTTTQIEHYDQLAAIFDNIRRIQVVLIDLCRDFWSYISMNYFRQKIKKGEIGSSAMPHKVNPIDFENAEGNLGLSNAIFDHLSNKLPVSRLQRDLTDSTVLRNIGVPLAHGLIALKSLRIGLGKIILNYEAISSDLENNWSIIAEAIQTILRRENYPNPYEVLLNLTRKHGGISKDSFHTFIDELNVPDRVKTELKSISPFNYTGIG